MNIFQSSNCGSWASSLVEANAEDRSAASLVDRIADVYRQAKAFTHPDIRKRHAKRLEFEEELLSLALPYVKCEVPHWVISERIVRFLSELFVFVENPAVPSENPENRDGGEGDQACGDSAESKWRDPVGERVCNQDDSYELVSHLETPWSQSYAGLY